MRPLHSCALLVCAVLALAAPAAAQIPSEFKNLQVLPKDISKPELVSTMRGFAGALGVRCKYCHVGPDNLEGMDFATDQLPTKKAARRMMRMVGSINDDHLAKLETERDTKVRVECATCHRGVTIPMQIEDLVAITIESQGVDAAVRRYSELRDVYYGSAAYDFGPEPLNDLAERLFRKGDTDTALTLAELNSDLHPDYVWSRVLQAGIHKSRGEKDEAIAAYEAALEIEPDNQYVKKQLEALRSESPSRQ